MTTSTHQKACFDKKAEQIPPKTFRIKKSFLDTAKATYFILSHLKTKGQLHKDMRETYSPAGCG